MQVVTVPECKHSLLISSSTRRCYTNLWGFLREAPDANRNDAQVCNKWRRCRSFADPPEPMITASHITLKERPLSSALMSTSTPHPINASAIVGGGANTWRHSQLGCLQSYVLTCPRQR